MARKDGTRDVQSSPDAQLPTAALWSAGAQMLHARSAAAVHGIVVRGAVELCSAASAAWWDRSDRVLSARFVVGLDLSGSGRVFRPSQDFLKLTDGMGPTVTVEDHQPGHLAFLERVGASSAVLIPMKDNRRLLGLLSVHDGVFDQAHLDLLAVLTQQAAIALRSLSLAAEARRLSRDQRSGVPELATALTSALSLDELLGIICRVAVGSADADVCLIFLAENESTLRLRARMGDAGPGQSAEKLLQIAEFTRSAPEAPVIWRDGSSAAPSVALMLKGTPFQSLLGLPLSIRGEPLGAMLFLTKRGHRFSTQQRSKLVHLGNQAAVAVENLRLFESTQRRLLEVADLNWVSTRIAASHDVATIASIVAGAASNTLDVPRIALFLQQEDGRFEAIPLHGTGSGTASGETLEPQGHIGAEVLATGSPLAVSDVEAEGRALDPLVRYLQARSLLCAPMTAQQGLRGFFAIADDRPRAFRSHDIGVLSNYGNQAALALQSAMLYQDTVRHLGELSRLFDISRSLASSLDLGENLTTILTSAAELLDAPVSSVMLSDPETGELAVKASHGLAADDELYARIRPGEGLAGRAFQAGVPLTSGDLSRDGRFKFRQTARERGLRTAIAAPLVARGRTLGVLNLFRTSPAEFTEDDKRLLASLAHSAAVAIENADLYREAQQRADFLSAMMSEINHRIRNTLQAISGLLRMELDRPQVSAESAIRRGISRIQAVAVVHELMRARELQFVDMKQVARRIFEIMCQSISMQCPIESVISGARVTLPSQRATSVALIFAELIDNALRHGLQNMPDGRISIGLAEGGGEVVVYVKDNGPGLPDGFDLDADSGFGLRIVRGLVEEELGGRLEMEAGDGLLVRFRFPKL